MGGDNAPDMVVEGVRLAHVRFPNVHFLLWGDETRLAPLVARHPELNGVVTLRHAEDSISGDTKPSQVLRNGRKSSMWQAINAVAKGEADGVVSAGNTGALMAASKFLLRTLPGIDRPAIAGFFPTVRGDLVMLDLGANVDCNANNLVEFAVMGEVFARIVLGIEQPTIGILNVGSEDVKGNDAVRTAFNALRETHLPIRFHGFVEGTDIGLGTVDIVVTDGFTGNITLKTIEGTAKLFATYLKESFLHSWLARVGYLFARSALNRLKLRMDPRRYNGAMFLGLNGIVIKSHGGTDSLGFANAIGVAVDLCANGFNDRIKADFARISGEHPELKAAQV